MTDELVLELAGVSRQFGAVRALRSVDFDCRAGEIHALVGENGSGKSTLLGVASGFVDPDRGTVRIGGRPLTRDSPTLARRLGLAMAYQDGSAVAAEPVKNNLYVAAGRGLSHRPPYHRRKQWARQVLVDLDLDLELFPDAPVGSLSMAERQLFEVAKALVTDPKVLLLDEPTTALGPDEVETLHRAVVACARRGVGVVYVSHRLPEVLEVAHRITVLRDGQTQGTFDAAGTTESELVERIVGRPFEVAFPTADEISPEADVALDVDGLQGQSFGPVSFGLQRGEVVGVAGAEGNGQAQLFDCLAGRTPPRAGRVTCAGRDLTLISTTEAVRAGIMLLAGDRKREALMGVLGVRVNATVQSLRRFSRFGLLRRRAERAAVEQLIERLEIRTPSLDQPVEFLSGGNQQKVSIARTFLTEPAVILAYEPTQGVDVGSRHDIYRALRARAAAGAAILVKSSDPIELSGLCDRVYVMSRGTIVEEIPGDELDEVRIVEAIVRGPGMSKAARSPLGVAMPKSPGRHVDSPEPSVSSAR
ncbi:sugar ABC transporter ATP-binding protein [Desertimonas flava]|uniref:sugar ABC transporter ATP-binding protein n=1 Tax=Desertimonas flava TaxID=2064846 RepID=UPI000E346A16|nr:sugar ABC transporter ATP-binding protein [Desertimonas flava]